MDWNQDRTMTRRLLFGASIMVLLAIGLIVRLGYWQIDQADALIKRAKSQWSISIPVQPRRGAILDVNGKVLALNVNADTIAAIPSQIQDSESTATQLAEVLSMSSDAVLEKLNSKSKQIYIKRMVSEEVSAAVVELNLPGIIRIQESKRFYPNGSLAAQVLGFSGIDKGWAGIELQYDKYMQGTKGEINFGDIESKDKQVTYLKPETGDNVTLTIDVNVQSLVEKHLQTAMTNYKAENVMAIALDVKTGALLAATSLPTYDPNNYQDFSENLRGNPLIEDVFEPGSTFKIITMAAALEEDVVNASSRFYCKGSIRIADRTINCWRREGHGTLDYFELMKKSCNMGFIELSKRIGKEKMLYYIEKFGFTRQTGIDLPGEGKGIMFTPSNFNATEMATTSFGQGPAVTPLQQIAAIAAIGNGGVMNKPYVVKEIRSESGELVYEHRAESERIISEDNARLVREMMEAVVNDGTGHRAFIEGYRIGGKTGTAQVPLATGGYDKGRYIASFIGLAPSNDPEIALFVAIKNRRTKVAYNEVSGGIIAAPLFKNIMKDMLHYLEVPTQKNVKGEVKAAENKMPDLIGQNADQAVAQIWALGWDIEREGSNIGVVVKQIPQAGEPLPEGRPVYLEIAPGEAESEIDVIVPDLIGMSKRDAAYVLGQLGLRCHSNGVGVVISQNPEAGSSVRVQTAVTIELESAREREEANAKTP